jgi:hypothetical protein
MVTEPGPGFGPKPSRTGSRNFRLILILYAQPKVSSPLLHKPAAGPCPTKLTLKSHQLVFLYCYKIPRKFLKLDYDCSVPYSHDLNKNITTVVTYLKALLASCSNKASACVAIGDKRHSR